MTDLGDKLTEEEKAQATALYLEVEHFAGMRRYRVRVKMQSGHKTVSVDQALIDKHWDYF